ALFRLQLLHEQSRAAVQIGRAADHRSFEPRDLVAYTITVASCHRESLPRVDGKANAGIIAALFVLAGPTEQFVETMLREWPAAADNWLDLNVHFFEQVFAALGIPIEKATEGRGHAWFSCVGQTAAQQVPVDRAIAARHAAAIGSLPALEG